MKKLTAVLFSSLLLLAAAACSPTARTSSDAPDSVDNTQAESPSAGSQQAAQEDASSDIRQKQIESDTRARQQRDQVTGDTAEKADTDIASEVRNKLETGLPGSQLTVESEDGAVAIAGTVSSQDQIDQIEPLAKQVQGVKSVNVRATVADATPDTNAQ